MQEDEIVGVGGPITAPILLQAYTHGIFPWPMQVEEDADPVLIWYRPKKRALLPVHHLHQSKRDLQTLHKSPYHFTVDQCFEQVISECQIRKDEGTWITNDLRSAYLDLHHMGHAHSVEVWEQETLVGGLYGVDHSGMFSGESMFHRKNNASKFAVWFAIQLLKNAGRFAMDVQVMTPHLKKWGAGTVPHAKFLRLLQEGQNFPVIPWEDLKAQGRMSCAQLAGLSEAE